VYPAPHYEPVRPEDRDSTSAPGSRGPGSTRQTTHIPSVDAAALRRRTTQKLPPEEQVTYVDRTLSCVDCAVEFIHSAADQEYYVQKGFVSDPKRCTSCRASRRAARDGGYDVREIGGPRGYERGDDRPMREYFAVICSSCGNQAQVPFKPRMDRPVYCSDCFRTVRPD
jgi:CxxC-x17-CxxC domain-containing protein